jgi:hypothetical protein
MQALGHQLRSEAKRKKWITSTSEPGN